MGQSFKCTEHDAPPFAYNIRYVLPNGKVSVIQIKNIKTSINNGNLIVINSTESYTVNSIQQFVKLWLNPIRKQWLINDTNHPLANKSFQYINSPIGNWRATAAYLSGGQCFVRQISDNNIACPEFNVINENFIYQMIKPDGTKTWIRIQSMKPTKKSKPKFEIVYKEIHSLS